MPNAKAFQDFLTKLSRDPSARTGYRDDPVGVMKAEGLSDSQVVAVLSQDPARIQDEFGPEFKQEFTVTVTIVVTITL